MIMIHEYIYLTLFWSYLLELNHKNIFIFFVWIKEFIDINTFSLVKI